MTNIVVDIEADGPCPGKGSMVSFGAVIVDSILDQTFYGQCRPITNYWVPEALAVSGHTREETLAFPDPVDTMRQFADWLSINAGDRCIFWADNNGFDWQWINYYFHNYYGKNPFGFSSQNINSLFKGLNKNMYASFKHLRKTKHTHHPVDDAKGNAEALLSIAQGNSFKGFKI
jgi:hypothetical protein